MLPRKEIFGFQIQQGSVWRPGLDDAALAAFEKELGFLFPVPLCNFYKTMNGLTLPGINFYGNNGDLPTSTSLFYSYPDDIQLIRRQIDWIYEATSVSEQEIINAGISGIFPVYGHRFMLIDHPDNPILSMYGDDIIYWADNISKLLANEIFGSSIYNISDFESPPQVRPDIKFWLDD